MNRTLTALVMTGALALGACKYDAYSDKGELIQEVSHDNYDVVVTDQESRRVAGILPRGVSIQAEYETMTPQQVIGSMDNALAPNATFTSGYIQYTAAKGNGCSWGPQFPEELSTRCTPTEVKNAQQMLITYSGFATK
jgi:hypothetical protein